MASVLVVDDEADIRSLVRELLERAGHDVVEAGDGNEGLRVFFSSRPDLVVLDVSMPGLDGWGTLERIRELSDVPVVMLTAQAQELAKVRGLRGGADDYITKPFGRQELLARVEANLRRQRSDADAPAKYGDGFVTVYTCGAREEVSSLNYSAGQTVANAVITPVSAAGTICLFSFAPSDVVVDINGWFASAS